MARISCCIGCGALLGVAVGVAVFFVAAELLDGRTALSW
jgi:hypothetical protein